MHKSQRTITPKTAACRSRLRAFVGNPFGAEDRKRSKNRKATSAQTCVRWVADKAVQLRTRDRVHPGSTKGCILCTILESRIGLSIYSQPNPGNHDVKNMRSVTPFRSEVGVETTSAYAVNVSVKEITPAIGYVQYLDVQYICFAGIPYER